MKVILTPRVRTWIYGVLLAAVPVLMAYGILDAQVAALWLAMAAAVLGLGTATAFRPTGRHAATD